MSSKRVPRTVALVVLDFDGVILESNDVKSAAFREVFARFPEHLEAMMAFHHANVSASRFVKFDHLLRERLGRPDDTKLRGELADEFSRRTRDELKTVPFVPGAKELLADFAPRVPLYLASVTPEEDLRSVLEARALGGAFKRTYGCPPWTKPNAIRDALQRERCEPANAVLIGDSPGDQRAAAETGVEFIARDSGITFHPPVQHAYHDLFEVAAFLRPRVS